MVKSNLKLKLIKSEAEEIVSRKDKRKQKKLKMIKSKNQLEKIIEQRLKPAKKPRKPKKGILGSISALEDSLNLIDCQDVQITKTKLSKKEKELIE
jgi:hypothetical protein